MYSILQSLNSSGLYVYLPSRAVLSTRNFCDEGNILHLCDPVWQPLAACSYQALEMWLVHLKSFILFFCLFFGHTACGILVPQPGTKPVSPALGEQSLNHWTAREVPQELYF